MRRGANETSNHLCSASDAQCTCCARIRNLNVQVRATVLELSALLRDFPAGGSAPNDLFNGVGLAQATFPREVSVWARQAEFAPKLPQINRKVREASHVPTPNAGFERLRGNSCATFGDFPGWVVKRQLWGCVSGRCSWAFLFDMLQTIYPQTRPSLGNILA